MSAEMVIGLGLTLNYSGESTLAHVTQMAGRDLWVLGEARVNVVELNLAVIAATEAS